MEDRSHHGNVPATPLAFDGFAGQRNALVAYGRMLADKRLLMQTSGNLSVRLPTGDLLITPTSIPYSEITPSDLVVANLDGAVVAGFRRPSSELPLHALVYRSRPDIRAIVHTHSEMATTIAVLNKPIPAVHYMIASLGVTRVEVAPYATFGSDKLARNVSAAFAYPARAVLIGNHGVVAGGPTLPAAANAAEAVELLAALYYRVLVAGGGVVLTDDQMAEVLGKYKAYGPLREEA
jgi:L-fuculose-phosphate aldolase